MVNFTLEWSDNINGGVSKSTVDIDPSNSYVVTNKYDSSTSSYGFTILNITDGSVEGDSLEIQDSNSIRFSPTGDYLASGGTDSVEVMDVSDKTTPSTHTTISVGDTVNSVSWSPNGNWLAYGTDNNTVEIRDNDPSNNFPSNNTISLNTVADIVEFSYDSSWISISADNTLVVYETANWTEDQIVSTFANTVNTWHNDDSFLYYAELQNVDYIIYKADTSTWSNSSQSNAYSGSLFGHKVPTTDDLIAIGSVVDSDTKILDTTDLSQINTLSDPSNSVNDVRFSSDGLYLASASDDDSIYLYSVSSASFSGIVTDTSSNAIEGATVWAINTSDGSITGKATTAADGTYSIDVPDTTTTHHLICQWTDSDSNEYYSKSLPYVTATQ